MHWNRNDVPVKDVPMLLEEVRSIPVTGRQLPGRDRLRTHLDKVASWALYPETTHPHALIDAVPGRLVPGLVPASRVACP